MYQLTAMSSCICALPLNAVVSCLTNFNDLPADPANGQRKVFGYNFGSTVTYSCDAGYKLIGPSTVICLANRKWSTSGNVVQCIGKSKCIINIAMKHNYINGQIRADKGFGCN